MANSQETARAKMRDLSSSNPATRRAAAYYLGEAAVDEAITRLATVYKSDPDASVRSAAAYSLGMFRAVEQALQRGEQQRVVKLLQRVSEQGKPGKRLRVRPATLARIEIGLALLLVVLIALHLLLPGLGPLPGGITLPSFSQPEVTDGGEADDVLNQTRKTYDAVVADLATLQSQFQAVLTGGTPSCTAFYNLPAPLQPAEAASLPTNFARLVDAVNAGQAIVLNSHARLERACTEAQPIEPSEVGGLLAPIVTAQNALSGLGPLLDSAEPVPVISASAEPSATPTPAPTATDAPPTATHTPTEIPPTETPIFTVDPRQHVAALYGIIDHVSGPRNAAGLLRQVWTDTAQAGTTRACREPAPPIPAAYVLTEQEASALPELAQAAEQVNLALTLLRQGWDLFASACTSGTLAQQASTGLQMATTVEDALRVADGLLQAVRGAF